MKTRTVVRIVIGVLFTHLLLNLPFFLPRQALAAESDQLEATERYAREELAQMLAPIALYPDSILSQVLIASTYPIEVIEADRWVKGNPNLKWQALDDALVGRDWDPSVKALCHFPTVLDLMSERIGETTRIGNAFLAQEEEVLDTIQELRAKAHAQGNLTSTPEQKVIVQKEKIIIKPANTRVVYVPYYDTQYVYGPWWYPGYSPYYWGPAPRLSIGLGISFWPGFYFSTAYTSWCRLDWHARYIYVDVHRRPRYVRHDRWVPASGRWRHLPSHRRGLVYRDMPTSRKYSNHPIRPERFRRDPRVFSAPRLQERLKNRQLKAAAVRERRARDSIRPQTSRNMPQRNMIPPRTRRPSGTQGDRVQRPRVQAPNQEQSRSQPQSRQRSVARPRSQKPSSTYGDRRQRPGVQSPNHVSPRIQTETQQRLGTRPRVQGTPRARGERQVNQRIKPETRRILPRAQSTKRVQQPRAGRKAPAQTWGGSRSTRSGRQNFSTRFGGSGRQSFSIPRGHVTPNSSTPAYLSGHGR